MSNHRKMNDDQQARREKFLRNYARLTEGYAIHAQKEPDDEGYFSWSACDTCGTTLGGNRTDMVLTNPGRDKRGRPHERVDVSSCDDCLYYAANGDLPDAY